MAIILTETAELTPELVKEHIALQRYPDSYLEVFDRYASELSSELKRIADELLAKGDPALELSLIRTIAERLQAIHGENLEIAVDYFPTTSTLALLFSSPTGGPQIPVYLVLHPRMSLTALKADESIYGYTIETPLQWARTQYTADLFAEVAR